MLKRLYIKNFTLIDELDIEFYSGFSVITGETGAGKSIILGAIGLLLGQRADSKTLKTGTEKCIIEAEFDLSRYEMKFFFDEYDIEYEPDSTIIRRELTATGKSRAFVNDMPVQLSTLKELGEHLIDVHSQHQNLLLNKHDFQLNVVDIIANDEKELRNYKQSYVLYLNTKKELSALQESIEQFRQQSDFMQFQYEELSQAKLMQGEQEELEQRCDMMSHAEEIKSALYGADHALSADGTGVVESLSSALYQLRQIGKVFPDAEELISRIDSSYIELKDVAQEISNQLENVDFDPAEFDNVNNRLDRIYDLEKKYHLDTVEALIEKRDEIGTKLNNIENSDEALEALHQKCVIHKEQAISAAALLTKLRNKAAKQIEKEMQARLIPLGMPNVRFSIDMKEEPLSANGKDSVSFLFSANTSTPLQPISQVASGGEIARVMLSLKAMISGAVKLPTIIFDEIDTGVSGKIAEKMAEIMKEMGLHERQVISITHLPQIAALGTTHYKVTKEETEKGTISSMHCLTNDERIAEIAQMLSGSNISEAAIQNAKQLLGL